MFNLKYLFITLLCLSLCGCGYYEAGEKIQFILNNKIYNGIVANGTNGHLSDDSYEMVPISFSNDLGQVEFIYFTHKQLVQMKKEIQQRTNTVIEK